MFAAGITIFALLTFLAGANAGCATCEETLEVNGDETYELVSGYMKYDNGYTECNYVDTKSGDKVTCEYNNFGLLEDGDKVCPQFSRMDGGGC